MKLGLVLSVYNDRPLDAALALAARHGYEGVELSVHKSGGLLDLDDLLKGNNGKRLRDKIKAHGLEISALGNHAEGQLVLGPHHRDTDWIFSGTAEEKIQYGVERMKKTAAVAEALEVPVVCGFCGCEDYSRWFPWPNEHGWEEMGAVFVERWLVILDEFLKRGVKFAHECHPKEYAYNTETAELTVELLHDHPAWGFNFDPANLMLAGVDPAVFVETLGKKIYHVHAKDGEVVPHNVRRSGLLAHGAWDRPDRGFRFRIPGWGDIQWRKLITELQLVGYDGFLAVENEDATMSREDGVTKSLAYLRPLLIDAPFDGRWW